jgi:hypothetical protein
MCRKIQYVPAPPVSGLTSLMRLKVLRAAQAHLAKSINASNLHVLPK